jgi:hypothetical protein
VSKIVLRVTAPARLRCESPDDPSPPQFKHAPNRIAMTKFFTAILVFAFAASLGQADSGYSNPGQSNAKNIRMLTPEVATFLKQADIVVAVVIDPERKAGEPGYETKPRVLAPDERAALIAILAAPENYYQGLYTVSEPPSTAGFEIRKGRQEMLIVTGGGLIDGHFGARRLTGMISDKGNARFTKWWEKYNPFRQEQ